MEAFDVDSDRDRGGVDHKTCEDGMTGRTGGK